MTTTYVLEIHNTDNLDSELKLVKASSIENAVRAAQWLYKGKLVTIPLELYPDLEYKEAEEFYFV